MQVAQHPKLIDKPNDAGPSRAARYACKMATGSGKTVVMAMLHRLGLLQPRHQAGRCALPAARAGRVPEPDGQGAAAGAAALATRATITSCSTSCPRSLRPELAKGKVLVTQLAPGSPRRPNTSEVGGVAVGQLGPESAGGLRAQPAGRLVGRRADHGAERRRPPRLPAGAGGRGRRRMTAAGKGRPRGGDGLGQRTGPDQRRLRHRPSAWICRPRRSTSTAAATRKARPFPGS